MLLHACGGFPGVSRSSRGSKGSIPGASSGLQGPPGAFSGNMVLNEKCARRVPPKPRTWARLKFHTVSGWIRPPTMAGGGRARLRRVCKGE